MIGKLLGQESWKKIGANQDIDDRPIPNEVILQIFNSIEDFHQSKIKKSTYSVFLISVEGTV